MKVFFKILVLFFLTVSGSLLAQDDLSVEQIKAGEKLFQTNCASCHAKDMKTKLTGPALGGVQSRWEGREELLYSWIRNSQSVIASGDAYAVSLYNEYNKSVMQSFPNLKDEDIDNILGYITAKYEGKPPYDKVVADGPAPGVVAKKQDNTWLYVILAVVLALLALVLARIVANLNKIAQIQETGVVPPKRTLVDMLTSRTAVGFLMFILILLGGYTTVNNAININRQQDYAPDQPIKYSHVTHAGIQQIDCQYCHDGARRSKHSVIPPTSTCMNCHSAIKVGSNYGTQELTKIYVSAGYDPTSNSYFDPAALSEDSLASLYKEWIEENYLSANSKDSLDAVGEREVNREWEHIYTSLITDYKDKPWGPIPWVRVHNLPDHAYFNHAQHVTVGKVECQTCHGPIEEMEVVQQYAPLSMGWCINCHRNTEVQFDNAYYEEYHYYKQEVEAGEREAVTVEDIGGIECQKCHY